MHTCVHTYMYWVNPTGRQMTKIKKGQEKHDQGIGLNGSVQNRIIAVFMSCNQVLEARLLERGKTSGRTDDNLESIKKRCVHI